MYSALSLNFVLGELHFRKAIYCYYYYYYYYYYTATGILNSVAYKITRYSSIKAK